jgi:hypothetical protein
MADASNRNMAPQWLSHHPRSSIEHHVCAAQNCTVLPPGSRRCAADRVRNPPARMDTSNEESDERHWRPIHAAGVNYYTFACPITGFSPTASDQTQPHFTIRPGLADTSSSETVARSGAAVVRLAGDDAGSTFLGLRNGRRLAARQCIGGYPDREHHHRPSAPAAMARNHAEPQRPH